MRKRIRIIILAGLLFFLLYAYPDIVVSVMAGMQYHGEVSELYAENTEPKARIAEITELALESMVSLDNSGIRYIAVDAKQVEGLSEKEVQYLISHFTKYNHKVIYVSMKELKRLGLYNPFGKHLNKCILLAIDEVEELTNESAVLKASYYYSGLGAAGYRFRLAYKAGKWQVEAKEMLYIA